MAYFTKGDIAQLDLVAIAILFEADDKAKEHYSAGKGKGAPTLADPTLKCVAVALDGDTLHVAANGLWITNELRKSATTDRRTEGAPLSGTIGKNILQGNPIAENQVELSSFRKEVLEGLNRILGYKTVNYIGGTGNHMDNYHAEMQLLDYLITNGIVPTPRYFGVSKPCCPECTAVLTKANVKFTESHTKNAHVRRNVEAQVKDNAANFGGTSLHPHLSDDVLARWADLD